MKHWLDIASSSELGLHLILDKAPHDSIRICIRKHLFMPSLERQKKQRLIKQFGKDVGAKVHIAGNLQEYLPFSISDSRQ